MVILWLIMHSLGHLQKFLILEVYFNYPYFPQNKYSIQVQFEQLDLFNKMLNRIFPLRHEGIIVISGNWSLTNNNEIDSKVKSKCGIFSEKQIAIIKKE